MADVEHSRAAVRALRPDFHSEADNWYGVVDPKQRKRIQDRLAQRARRKRLAEVQGSQENVRPSANATPTHKRRQNQAIAARKKNAVAAAVAAERSLLLRAERTKTVRDVIKDIRDARKAFVTVTRYLLPLGVDAASVERMASEYALEQLGLRYQEEDSNGDSDGDGEGDRQRKDASNARKDKEPSESRGKNQDISNDDVSIINEEIEDPTGTSYADPFARILEQIRDGTAQLPPLDAPSSLVWSMAARSTATDGGAAGTAGPSQSSSAPWQASSQPVPSLSEAADVVDTSTLIPPGVTEHIHALPAPFSDGSSSDPTTTAREDPLIPSTDPVLTARHSTALTTLPGSGPLSPSIFLPPTISATNASTADYIPVFPTFPGCGPNISGGSSSSSSGNSGHHTTTPMQTPFPLPQADPFFMSIPLVAVYAALWHNGAVLSLTCVPTEVRHISDRRQRNPGSGVPRDLRPTRLQVSQSHMTWIDRFPSARFRDNMIRLTETGAVDANAFMYDIFMMPSFYIVPGGVSWVAGDWRLSEAFAAKWGFAFS